MTTLQLPIWVWPAALMTVCLLALWRGRDDERLAAVGELATWALSMVVYRREFEGVQWAILAIDASLLGLFLWIALRSVRFWPLFAAAFQLLAMVTHGARMVDTDVSTWAYMTAGLTWNYLALFAIGYGAWTAPSRYAEIGEAPNAVAGATRR